MIDRISDLAPAEMLADALLSDAIDQALEVPRMLDVLPDGREVVVIGDVKGSAEFNHKQGDHRQGDNFEQITQTCGLVSCENVLRQFGIFVTEDTLVGYTGEVGLRAGDGTTTAVGVATVLTNYGVPSHVANPLTLETLASEIESGRGVIAGVNAGVLWDDRDSFGNGNPNHAINVSGVGRDPATGAIIGFYINDSGTGESGKFIDIDTFRYAFAPNGGGGEAVVTDAARSFATPPMV